MTYTTVAADETTAQVTFTYDEKGNQLTETDAVSGITKESEYSVSGCLTGHTITKDGETVLVQENTYNGDGQRVIKSENGTVTKYVNGESGVLYTADGSGNVTSFNLYGESGNLISSARTEEGSENFYFYNKDIEGSTTTLLDNDTDSVGLYSYTDFGETSEVQTVSIENEICYTGAVYDESTGLYYLNARYYNPVTGRFVSQDTYRGETGDPSSWWLYAYCANNPINYTDPSGHKKFSVSALKKASWLYKLAAKHGIRIGNISKTDEIPIVSVQKGIVKFEIRIEVGLDVDLGFPVSFKYVKNHLTVSTSTKLGKKYEVGTSVSVGWWISVGSGVAYSYKGSYAALVVEAQISTIATVAASVAACAVCPYAAQVIPAVIKGSNAGLQTAMLILASAYKMKV